MNKYTGRIGRRISRAFTLIELMLVLVILGVLAAVVVPNLAGKSKDAKVKAAKLDVSNIGQAVDQFEIDNGRFPTTDEGIGILLNPPNNHEPYLKKMPVDPWGQQYYYRCPGQRNPRSYDVFSTGPDMQEGSPNIIGNWE